MDPANFLRNRNLLRRKLCECGLWGSQEAFWALPRNGVRQALRAMPASLRHRHKVHTKPDNRDIKSRVRKLRRPRFSPTISMQIRVKDV